MTTYHSLSKEQKKQVKELYQKKYATSDFKARLSRLQIYALIGYVFASFLLIYSLITHENFTSSIILASILVLISTFYLLSCFFLRLRIYNKLALSLK